MISRLIPFLCLLFVAVEIGGQDFDLGEALDSLDTTPKQPTPTKKPGEGATGGGSNDFNLYDFFDNAPEATKKPSPKPQPANPGAGGGSFDDSDLIDGNIHDTHPDEDGTNTGGQENKGEEKTSLIAGIASTIGVAALGAISSFIAYQKKKLCFKEAGDDPENVNMENQNRDPQVQSSLLSKS